MASPDRCGRPTSALARRRRYPVGQLLAAPVRGLPGLPVCVRAVWVTLGCGSDLRTPFGGMKDSGTGREGGKYSLEFYSETKNVCIHLGDRLG